MNPRKLRTFVPVLVISALMCCQGAVRASAASSPPGLVIADHGVTHYTIAISAGSSTAVRNAAAELSDDLFQMTGARLPVTTVKSTGPAIFVGAGGEGRSERSELKRFGPESFVLETGGPNLYIEGADARGALYGVYRFLEQYLGVRWYAPDCTVLPSHSQVLIGQISDRQSPAFAFRDIDAHVVSVSAAWDAHILLNGSDVPNDPNSGGNYPLFSTAENFYDLAPPDKYFAAHPEYYSLIDDKRTTNAPNGSSQLCLTNPDVFNIVTDALTAQAQKNPSELCLGLSPNDAPDGNCTDALCAASDARYGAPSGTLLNFVNNVAHAVQERIGNRKIWVETLAYQYTERAPKPGTIRPASNVLVCLAPIYACVSHPIATDPQSAASKEALLAWSKIAAGHLQIWHYSTNFANYLQPLPDFDELGPDMAWYRQNGVAGVFVEGDYNNVAGMLEPMRTWVLAHLLWNPSQDIWVLANDFCNGYYGAAGPDVYAYLRLFHTEFQDPKMHMHIYDPPTARYFNSGLLKAADLLFVHAYSVSTDPVIAKRLDQIKMGLDYVELMQTKPGPDTDPAMRAAWSDRFEKFANMTSEFNIADISEGRPIAPWIQEMRNLEH